MESGHRFRFLLLFLFLLNCLSTLRSQSADVARGNQTEAQTEHLKFAVVFTRHGVRSPTGKGDAANAYSSTPWPEWEVAPGYLTAHGAELMRLVGAYDRQWLAQEGLLAADGCADAAHIRILADSDQRTRETGKAWARGFAPACELTVSARAEGTADPLFHPLEASVGHPDKQQAAAEVMARLGGKPESLAPLHQNELQLLEEVLTGCKSVNACPATSGAAPHSLFELPASVHAGSGDHMVDLRGPLSLAATLSENLLLEYTEGFSGTKLGWGRLDHTTLSQLIELHTANEDLTQRSPSVARAQASNLLFHMEKSMEEAIEQKPVNGALIANGDKLLLLVGHDTNLANLSGALHLNWTLDGRADDTPPGSALVFEVWEGTHGTESIKAYFTTQTLDQMRNATPLTLAAPPERVAVAIPGCSNSDGICSWSSFQTVVERAVNQEFVK